MFFSLPARSAADQLVTRPPAAPCPLLQCPYQQVIPVMKQGIEMTMMFGGLLGGMGQGGGNMEL